MIELWAWQRCVGLFGFGIVGWYGFAIVGWFGSGLLTEGIVHDVTQLLVASVFECWTAIVIQCRATEMSFPPYSGHYKVTLSKVRNTNIKHGV